VFTANKLPLEEVFGVDLIFFNMTRRSVVMLQYKMLEPDGASDWIYRPDAQLDEEIQRMRAFSADFPAGAGEYRLNPDIFYFKFVKRDGAVGDASLIMPLDHFEIVRNDRAAVGPRNGIRISYNSLSGNYLRQTPFVDLLRSGYIGAHAETTAKIKTLVDWVSERGHSVVAAIQRPTPPDSANSHIDASPHS